MSLSKTPFTITIDDSKVQAWLSKMPRQIRKRGQQGMRQWGNHAVERLLQQARAVGIKQFRRSGSMFTNTKYVQKEDVGIITMPKSGMFQDRAKPHWVFRRLRNGNVRPMVHAWMSRYGVQGSGFYFRPKPYIRQGLRNARTRLMPIMRPQIHAAIRESHP